MNRNIWMVTDQLRQQIIIEGFYGVRESNLPAVAYVADKRDAAFIVKAVNNHDALVAACRLAALHFARMAAASDQWMGDDEHEAWAALEKALRAVSGAPEDG